MMSNLSLVLCGMVLQLPLLSSLHLLHISVPKGVKEGGKAELTCSYKTSPGHYIDSIKWYHNDQEIYRILLSLNTNRVMVFPIPGLDIELPHSGIVKTGTHRLTINKLDRRAQGTYSCQVTESLPPFHTAEMGQNMIIAVAPESGPSLDGLEPEYQSGSVLSVNCHTQPANPSPNITWTINREQVTEGVNSTCEMSNTTQLYNCSSSLRHTVSLPRANITSKEIHLLEVACITTFSSVLAAEEARALVRVAVSPHQPILGEPLTSTAPDNPLGSDRQLSAVIVGFLLASACRLHAQQV